MRDLIAEFSTLILNSDYNDYETRLHRIKRKSL
jgi:hypothetical protein